MDGSHEERCGEGIQCRQGRKTMAAEGWAYQAALLGFLSDRARLLFVGSEWLLAEDVLACGYATQRR